MDDLSKFLYERYVSRFKADGGEVRPLSINNQRWLQGRILPLLESVPRSGAILELGCGPGHLLGFLKNHGYTNCRGVDLCEEQVDIATKAGLLARQADLFDTLRAAAGEYHAIIAIDVIEHIERGRLLEFGILCRNALRPSGLLLMQTPNGEGLHAGHVIYGDLTHRVIFNESSLRQYLRALEFNEIIIRETAPVAKGFKGAVRWLGWKIIRGLAIAKIMVETGRRPRILTQELLCSGRAPLDGGQGSSASPARPG